MCFIAFTRCNAMINCFAKTAGGFFKRENEKSLLVEKQKKGIGKKYQAI